MYKFIALSLVLGLVGISAAQDLDAPTSGAPIGESDGQSSTDSQLFDHLMARIQAHRTEIEANRVVAWAFDDRYGWIWQIGAEGAHPGTGQLGFGRGRVTQEQLDEAQWVRDNLTPAEYAEFQNQAHETWWALEAQGLN